MLRLRCASYTYPAMPGPALGPLELTVGHGEVVGVVGPSEAGKSTLGLVLSGMAPTVVGGALDGSLDIDGESMRGRPSYVVAGHVGYVSQNPSTQISNLSRTVYEEVALGPMNLGLSRADIAVRVQQAISRLGIERLELRDPRRLSGGEAQLVAISFWTNLRHSSIRPEPALSRPPCKHSPGRERRSC
jgi:energy-coupling factor transport system ATP-binding protein